MPRELQQKVLLFGITFALVLRTVFILVGAAAIENFSWVFYLFGAILIYTAWVQARSGGHGGDEDYKENARPPVRPEGPADDGGVPLRPDDREGSTGSGSSPRWPSR